MMKFIYDDLREKLINCSEISIIEINDDLYDSDDTAKSCTVSAKLKSGYHVPLQHFFREDDILACEQAWDWIECLRLYLTNNDPWIFG